MQQAINRVLLPKDWKRFDYYAAKIRELGYDPFMPANQIPTFVSFRVRCVPMMTYTSLCVVRLPCELLPNVRRVRWTTHDFHIETYLHLFMFLNSPLVSLDIDFRDLTPDQRGWWDPLPSAAPDPDPAEEGSEGDGSGSESDGEEDENEDGSDAGGEQAEADAGAPPADQNPDGPGELFPGAGPPPDANPQAEAAVAGDANDRPSSPEEPQLFTFRDEGFIVSTLQAILEQSPDCKVISIMCPVFEGYERAVKTFLRKAQDLREFCTNVQAWEDEDLMHLAAMPTLKEAQIWLASEDNSWITRVPTPVSFPALTALGLDMPTLSCATGLFIHWGDCRLAALYVLPKDRPVPGEVRAFTETLAQACCGTLEALLLADGCTQGERDARPLVGADLIPLAECRRLSTLRVGISGAYHIANAEFVELVENLRELELLRLGPSGSWGAEPTLTFAALGALVRACPKLCTFALALETRVNDLAEAGDVPPNERVREVYLGDSIVSDSEEGADVIARSLLALFPNVELVGARYVLPAPEPLEEDAMMVDNAAPSPDTPAQEISPAAEPQASTAGTGEADSTNDAEEDLEESEDEIYRLAPWAAGSEFWGMVTDQISMYKRSRYEDIDMDTS